ncbi:AbrB/MazE/SpoVT family DNA-binding domain-containing protein [Candidatus Amesbacteria bacterium]|nr:AbrB/MazE/SpoVT family DNA-binding domain-containing protein [Candidatus Amesbacteria bacterium]
MSLQHYSQSFSQGQITIPKSFRTQLGLGDKFWLKMILDQNRIILEPALPYSSKTDSLQKLLAIKGDWLDEKELKRNRQQVEKRFKALKW